MQLSEFLRKSSVGERSEIAKRCGSSVSYLYQIAGGHRFASARLALKIERATARLANRAPNRLGQVCRQSLIKHPEIFDWPKGEREARD